MLSAMLVLFFSGHALSEEVLSAVRKASDMAASAVFPANMVTSDYVEASAAGEPYLIKCTPQANRIVLFLHTWSNDYRTVKQVFPELASLERACVVAPNFNGPNNTPQALGSDDTMDRIDIVIKEVQYKTGLSSVYLTAVSGGTMAALNYMGKYPGKIHSASLWLVIYDLASLYNTTQDQSLKDDMLKVLGAPPTGPDDPAYLARSPRARLATITGPTKIIMNVGAQDTTSPPAQADMAKAQINAVAPGIPLALKSWPIPHEFAPAIRQEALKQLILE
jgi:pimeloyl-ACP methyl ester carboxylesterase